MRGTRPFRTKHPAYVGAQRKAGRCWCSMRKAATSIRASGGVERKNMWLFRVPGGAASAQRLTGLCADAMVVKRTPPTKSAGLSVKLYAAGRKMERRPVARQAGRDRR